jgi:site-specific recombinase
MAGFFVLILILAAVHYWYVVLGGIALWVSGLWLLETWRDYRAVQAREAADRLRHEQARREIRQITAATTQAMIELTRRGKP